MAGQLSQKTKYKHYATSATVGLMESLIFIFFSQSTPESLQRDGDIGNEERAIRSYDYSTKLLAIK
jgi:hypothetical protein